MKSDAEAFVETLRKLTPEVMRDTANRAGLYLCDFRNSQITSSDRTNVILRRQVWRPK